MSNSNINWNQLLDTEEKFNSMVRLGFAKAYTNVLSRDLSIHPNRLEEFYLYYIEDEDIRFDIDVDLDLITLCMFNTFCLDSLHIHLYDWSDLIE